MLACVQLPELVLPVGKVAAVTQLTELILLPPNHQIISNLICIY